MRRILAGGVGSFNHGYNLGPKDLAHAMYRLLGINAPKRIFVENVRPANIVNGGRLVNKLIE